MSATRQAVLAIGMASMLSVLPAFVVSSALAQDHSQHQPATKKPAAPQPSSGPPERKESDAKPSSAPEAVDHAAMGHGETQPSKAVDHAAMGHDAPPKGEEKPVDHAALGHGTPNQSAEHAGHDTASDAPKEPIPALTDADRAAAFPDIREGHAAHDSARHSFLLFDQLEAWEEDDETGLGWDVLGWAGGDVQRLWIRSEGERFAGRTESADLEVLYGRAIARWWDGVIGVQQDFGRGPSQTFVGVGVIGVAPYKFELEASAYIGESGQTRAMCEAEYELLLTNRLIAQPLLELTLHGEDDERRGIGAGLSKVEAGLRLRYELNRRFAPYLGVVYERAFSRTADFRRAEGEAADDTIVVAGVRTWF